MDVILECGTYSRGDSAAETIGGSDDLSSSNSR